MIVSSPCELIFKLIDILSKENHEVCFVSLKDFSKENKPKNPYLYFRNNENYSILESQVQAIHPDSIFFLRSDFESPNYNNNFIAFLDLSVDCKARFFYLSNMDVLRRAEKLLDETAEIRPVSTRGEVAAQCEYRIRMKHQSYGLSYIVMRTDIIYGKNPEEDNAFVHMGEQILSGERIQLTFDKMVYPVHCDDLAYAMKLSMDSSRDNEIYHVLGGREIMLSDLYQLIAEKIGRQPVLGISRISDSRISGEKILNQLEWVRFHDLNRDLEGFPFQKLESKLKEKKKRKAPRWQRELRQSVEMIVLFVLFILLDQIVRKFFMQDRIDCMLIYIIAVAIRYRTGWTYSAISLTMIYNFFRKGLETLGQFGFFSFADNIAHVVLYLVVGIMVSSVVENLRAEKEEIRRREIELEQEKKELQDINAKILIVKDEYEKRVLSTKYSFSSLQSVLNKISVLHPEKIMVELMGIIADMLETKTVSIYTVSGQYVRLLVSKNDESVFCGKSWNMSANYPAMYETLSHGEIYQGNTFTGEPALMAPIMKKQKLSAFVVINEMKFENMSMYYINLLKTLVIVSSDMVYRANEYDGETKNKHFVDNTGIANYEWFRRTVQFEKEKTVQGFSTYFIARCAEKENIPAIYEILKGMFRSTDAFGMDREGHLCILFKNVSEKDRYIVLDKINSRGIRAEMVNDID